MKKRMLTAVAIFTMMLAVAAFAGSNLNYKAALHVVPHQERACETGWPATADCAGIQTTYHGCSDFDVFPVFFDLVEVRRIEYAITWPADWGACAYTACAGDNIIGGITSPGDGIAHAWTQCHEAAVIIPGYARFEDMVSPGLLVLAANPATGFLGATDCGGQRDFAIGLVAAGVCGVPGEDACDCGCASEPQTWGAIKSLFQ
jgi:hypothetical protein